MRAGKIHCAHSRSSASRWPIHASLAVTDPRHSDPRAGRPAAGRAFTLIELLVIIDVERVPFKKLWAVRGGKVLHSFWYLED